MKAFCKELGFWLFATMPMTIGLGAVAASQGHWWGWFVFPAFCLCAAFFVEKTRSASRRESQWLK